MKKLFLAVPDSSIGDLVTDSLTDYYTLLNKLTKLGRCDRYTIELLIIGLLGLLGLLGVKDC